MQIADPQSFSNYWTQENLSSKLPFTVRLYVYSQIMACKLYKNNGRKYLFTGVAIWGVGEKQLVYVLKTKPAWFLTLFFPVPLSIYRNFLFFP